MQCLLLLTAAAVVASQASDQYLLDGLKRLCEAALAEVRPVVVHVLLVLRDFTGMCQVSINCICHEQPDRMIRAKLLIM